MENILYLLASVSLTATRNITSKKTAAASKDLSQFFFSQSVLFLSAALLLIFLNPAAFVKISGVTVIYGVIYGVLLILSQWMFTLALKRGSTSICSVVYSLGFILPTISGTLFWGEPFTLLNLIGLILAISVIFLTVKRGEGDKKAGGGFAAFILIAMVASGGLGIMQKLQQTCPAKDERSLFLIIAFGFAFLGSALAYLLSKKEARPQASLIIYPAITGLCFGGANLLNTILAGRMKSAVFFPLQNISTILLSTLLGILIFKEKLTAKTAVIILLGASTVVIFSL
ncbi:MAG: hypothetical protein IJ370_04995 [Oscillospiraceae bacterium]|nr:hypothetical protein [Oscillospiraceae bacterium]